jgi:sulfatase maturation enzyme AslB (radical SAM superfamily)
MLYYMRWFFSCKLLGRRKPLQSVIFITDLCNLRCQHCNVVKEGPAARTKTLEQIRDELQYCYDHGSRMVDFEGGEPHLWKDASDAARASTADGSPADINTLVELAAQLGFFSSTVTTNAQLPITANSDLIWISIDGSEATHDEQRGAGSYQRALANIDKCQHPNLNVNMTITNRNWRDFHSVANLVREHPHLNRMSFSFYVPYDSRELLVPLQLRSQIIDTALQLKREGYPLMNSAAALDLLRDPARFVNRRQCWISNFILADGSRLATCPGELAGVCADCGFGMAAEEVLLWSLHPQMVKAGLSVRQPTRPNN